MDFEQFSAAYAAGDNQILFQKLSADLDTPVSIFMKLAGTDPHSFLLESVTGGDVRGRYSIIGTQPDKIWTCHGDASMVHDTQTGDNLAYTSAPLDVFRAFIDQSQIDLPLGLPKSSAGLFGYMGYDMVRHIEHLPNINPDPIETPDAMMMRPMIIAVLDAVNGDVTVVTPVWHSAAVTAKAAYDAAQTRISQAMDKLSRDVGASDRNFEDLSDQADPQEQSNFTKDGYLAAVEKAKEYIKKGDIFQVVPSQRWTQDFDIAPLSFYRALRRTNPSPFMFYFNMGEFHIAGASPEILVRVMDNEVTIRPIAGTRPRGMTTKEDKELELDLLADQKELAEHLMLLDLGRNDVGRVSKLSSVEPTEKFIIERYSHVMHIVSNVVGQLDESKDTVDAFFAGMPAGTVSGAPKVRAMEIIDDLEPEKRGIYGGGLGYFSASGDMDMCIALRTAVIKNGRLYFQSGGGVVYDSDPMAEYMETVHKSNAIRSAAKLARRYSGQNSD